MSKSAPKKKVLSILPFSGWLLICKAEDNDGKRTGPWYIAWMDVFGSKKSAIEFARRNGWSRPYRAVRGQLRAMETTDADK